MRASGIERIWYGDGAAEHLAQRVLAPLAWGYGGITALRNALYDRGMLRSHQPPLPALSIGNLSVGGTGKTPVAAWAASRLKAAGAVIRFSVRSQPGPRGSLRSQCSVAALRSTR